MEKERMSMEIFDRTSVIQGDDQCRDGHYRVKENLLEMAASEDGAEQRLDAKAAISLQAQNPTTLGEVRVGSASEEAAGIPAIWNTMLYGIGDMGVMRAPEAFLKINHVTGFDCQSCAWPSPDKHRKVFEFCENGAKAVSDESTRKRVTPEFFARYSIEELAAKSDYWLNRQGRLTTPMVRHADTTHYEPISWTNAFAMIAEELNSLDSPDQASFYTSGKTTNEPAFLLQLFARQFGTNNLPDCSNMCHESSGVAMVRDSRRRQGRGDAGGHGELGTDLYLWKQSGHEPSTDADITAKGEGPGSEDHRSQSSVRSEPHACNESEPAGL